MANDRRPATGDQASQTGRHALVLAVLLLAFGLRIFRLGADSLWYDETVSVNLAGDSLPALVAHTAGDIHPPGYYVLLHAWLRLAGRSEFAAAFPSLFFGVLLVALAYRLAARLPGGRGAGLLAALLVAVSPFNVWYSQEVRMYTLAAALGLGVLAATLRLIETPVARGPSRRALVAYVVCAALGLWVLYYFAFLLVAVNLMILAWWLADARSARAGGGRARGGRAHRLAPTESQDVGRAASRWGWLGRWLAAQVAAVILYAPWLPVAWRQATQPPVPPWRSWTGLGDVLAQTWTALGLGQSARPAAVWPVLVLIAALFLVGLFAARRRPAAWLMAGYVFLPVALIYAASFVTPLFHVRYAFTYSTPFYIVLAGGLAAVGRRSRPAMWAALGVLVVFSGLSIAAYHRDPRYAADDHRAAVAFLAERWRPGDAILIDAGYVYPAVLTYWRGDPIAWRGRLVGDGWPVAGQTGSAMWQAGSVDGDPGLGWGRATSDFYAMSRADTAAALDRLFAEYDRVWLYRVYDTVTDPSGFIREWLAERGMPFEDRAFTGESQLRVQGFLTGRDPLAGVRPEDRFEQAMSGGTLQLLAASVPARQAAVGSALDLAPVWSVGSSLPDDAILFAGLFDAAGGRWAQADERPMGSLYPAADWPAGATIRTPLRLRVPPGTPPGTYRLEIGWYRFADGRPLWLPWPGGDRLPLGDVTVTAPADWRSLPLPAVQHPAGVTFGGARLLGFNTLALRARAGDALTPVTFWQGMGAGIGTDSAVVLRLTDDTGRVVAEAPPATLGPLAAGQSIRRPQAIQIPGGLPAGAYSLSVGVRRADGAWEPARRGLFPLGAAYPLATVMLESRPVSLTPPAVARPRDAQFGAFVRLLGYELRDEPPDCTAQMAESCGLRLSLYWQALEPAPVRLKLFVHVIVAGRPSSIPAQADLYPDLPSTAWVAGEYITQTVRLDLPAGLAAGSYSLIAGFYDEASGARLPALDAAGQPMGDSVPLQDVSIGQ